MVWDAHKLLMMPALVTGVLVREPRDAAATFAQQASYLFDGDRAAADELWLSPRLTPKQAVRLLDDHDHEWLRNGHVEVSMYVRAERSTLRLTEHRSIVWIAEQPDTEARITAVLTRAGLAERPTLRTWADVPHLHYRPAGTTPRAGLPKKYTAAQLRKISR